ncbi:unnamed protein product [Dimorphilus gyrociliatus]|uniref:Tyrosine-protein kinase ephrin type A/B receptor-like domain-containing protein n=1 Tax=Dimorphilus gyrociliatus TaxID=2664684 RepID=A0A7I8VVK5_9ANNE|nr:unnamed protein product [Dimorphilus gyrociliatus]
MIGALTRNVILDFRPEDSITIVNISYTSPYNYDLSCKSEVGKADTCKFYDEFQDVMNKTYDRIEEIVLESRYYGSEVLGWARKDTHEFQCVSGYEEDPYNSNLCRPCRIGSYRNSRRSYKECQPCPPGRYSSMEGLPKCNKCPQYKFSTFYASKTVDDCIDAKPTWFLLLGGSITLPCIPSIDFERVVRNRVNIKWTVPFKETYLTADSKEFMGMFVSKDGSLHLKSPSYRLANNLQDINCIMDYKFEEKTLYWPKSIEIYGFKAFSRTDYIMKLKPGTKCMSKDVEYALVEAYRISEEIGKRLLDNGIIRQFKISALCKRFERAVPFIKKRNLLAKYFPFAHKRYGKINAPNPADYEQIRITLQMDPVQEYKYVEHCSTLSHSKMVTKDNIRNRFNKLYKRYKHSTILFKPKIDYPEDVTSDFVERYCLSKLQYSLAEKIGVTLKSDKQIQKALSTIAEEENFQTEVWVSCPKSFEPDDFLLLCQSCKKDSCLEVSVPRLSPSETQVPTVREKFITTTPLPTSIVVSSFKVIVIICSSVVIFFIFIVIFFIFYLTSGKGKLKARQRTVTICESPPPDSLLGLEVLSQNRFRVSIAVGKDELGFLQMLDDIEDDNEDDDNHYISKERDRQERKTLKKKKRKKKKKNKKDSSK